MTTIRIYDCDAKEIIDIANVNGISVADVIEEMVAEYLQSFKDAKMQ